MFSRRAVLCLQQHTRGMCGGKRGNGSRTDTASEPVGSGVGEADRLGGNLGRLSLPTRSKSAFDSAGPSTSVGMGLLFEIRVCQENLGRPKGALQIPPLRYASVGMTKGRVALSSRFDAGG